MEASNHFDDQLRRVLENLESNFDPGSWDMLEQRMDAEALDEIDEVVKERFDEMEVPVQPGSWEEMEQLIEADETAEMLENEALIDNLAYEKLKDLNVPYQGHHWLLMARRLEEEFSVRHQLYRYKVAEVGLMALLLLTIIRFLPYADQLLFPETNIEESGKWQPVAPEAELPAGQPLPPLVSPENQDADAGDVPVAAVQVPDNPASYGQSDSKPSIKPVPSGREVFAGNRDAGGMTAISEVDPVASVQLNRISPEMERPALFEKIVARNLKRSRLQTPGTRSGELSPDLLAALGSAKVKSNYSWELPALKTAVFKKTNELRFSIFTTTDFNYILTPKDDLYILDTVVHVAPDTSLALGYGGGILASLKRDKWEIQTGGIYSFKRYLPNTPVFFFKTFDYYIKEDFHGIQLDILQVPLNVQYHFKDHGNWRFYGAAGVSAHLITSSVYEIDYQATPAFSALPPPPVDPKLAKSIRQEKDFPEGLADGGLLRDNFYMTANVGVGLERYISTKWTLFFQPSYQHYLMSEGIGTNRDKVYTMSILLGTKFSID